MKKHLKCTILLVLSLLFIIPASAFGKTIFKDVPNNATYLQDLNELVDRQVISGYPDGRFGPENYVTRGQAAKMFVRFLKLQEETFNAPIFKDVPASDSFYKDIALLAHFGIINGFEDGTFRPNQTLTREQMAIIMTRAFNLTSEGNNYNPFIDVKYGKSMQAILNLYANDITKGVAANLYAPNDNVKRSQLVSFLMRAERAKADQNGLFVFTKPTKNPMINHFYVNHQPTGTKLRYIISSDLNQAYIPLYSETFNNGIEVANPAFNDDFNYLHVYAIDGNNNVVASATTELNIKKFFIEKVDSTTLRVTTALSNEAIRGQSVKSVIQTLVLVNGTDYHLVNDFATNFYKYKGLNSFDIKVPAHVANYPTWLLSTANDLEISLMVTGVYDIQHSGSYENLAKVAYKLAFDENASLEQILDYFVIIVTSYNEPLGNYGYVDPENIYWQRIVWLADQNASMQELSDQLFNKIEH